MTRTGVPGTTYLLHLDLSCSNGRSAQPGAGTNCRQVQHFAGAGRLEDRLAEHGTGKGARLLAVAKAAGSGWRLARTWPGTTRAFERHIKEHAARAALLPRMPAGPRTGAP